MYLQLGDAETTRETVKDGLKIAEKLYARDTDIADASQIIKANWPSVGTWCQLVSLAAHISVALASRFLPKFLTQK
jgi:hypothetical protein